MDSIMYIMRFIVPVITLIILLVCFGSLFINRPKSVTLAKLVDKDNEQDEIDITHWETSIGAHNSNDIVVKDQDVDNYHIVITNDRSNWRVQKANKTSVLLVNGEPIKKFCYLSNNALIQIGNKAWYFRCEEAITPEEKERMREEAEKAQENIEAPARTRNGSDEVKRPIAILRNISTDKVSYIYKEKITIGSSKDCDIVLPSITVDPIHATLELRRNQWILNDLGSREGTTVNRYPVTEPTNIYDLDMIKIGVYIFNFFDAKS